MVVLPFTLETQGSFGQDLFQDYEDTFPGERWGDLLLGSLPLPHPLICIS